MKIVTIATALKRVSDYPNLVDDELIQLPAYELVCRSLFEIANRPDQSVRGSMARANKARALILTRMVGRRRSGTHPATRENIEVEFIDLTGGEIG